MISDSQDRYLIDPVTEFVGQIDASGEFVTIVRNGNVWSVGRFVSRNQDAVCFECRDPAELNHAIGALQDKTTALDFWLMLFDPEIRDDTKKRVASELDVLFSNDSVYTHVQDIVYSAPLSASASTRFVEKQALGKRVKDFATELVAAQSRVRDLFAVWAGMKSEPLAMSVGHRELTGRLINKSFFRKVVTRGKTQADVDQLAGSLAFELREVCDPRLVSRALTEYKHTLPRGERQKRAIIPDSDHFQDDSLQLLRRAIEQPKGLDVILYMQIGNEFRSIREFEKALQCYEKAKSLDDGSKADGIRDEIIRVSVAKGEYDLALTQYNEIVDIQQWPSTLASLGTLHRKMGNLRSARECYWSVLDRCKGLNDVAHAGLAEASKQSGNLHLAIKKYQAIFKNYSKVVEPSSVRVYSLALSQLLMLTRQYQRASAVLKGLKDCALDHEVNFILAKIYMLGGQTSLASEHMQRAKVPDLRGIASELFQFVMSLVEPVNEFQLPAEIPKAISINNYLPEERGLAACRNAVAAIIEHQYNEALDSLRDVQFVDKIHNDFGCVLRFHANRCKDSQFDFRESQAFCRILKRGFPPLRKTAISIANSNFDDAVQQELRFCLHVA